jgi:hypothetical protein
MSVFAFFFVLVGSAWSIPLDEFEATRLRVFFIEIGALPTSPATVEETLEWIDAGWNATLPECPGQYVKNPNAQFACDATGKVSSFKVSGQYSSPRETAGPLIIPRASRTEFDGVVVRESIWPVGDTLVELVVRNSVFLGSGPAFRPAPLTWSSYKNLTFDNVTLPDYDPNVVKDDTFLVKTCLFRNVRWTACPLPRFLWFCHPGFNESSASAPPCEIATPVKFTEKQSCSFLCSLVCSPPPAVGAKCAVDGGFKPSVRGFSTIELIYQQPSFALSLTVNNRNLVARIELFSWASLSWIVVHDQLADRRDTTNNPFLLPHIFTNRVRLTLELWFDTDVFTFARVDFSDWPSPFWPPPPALRSVCPAAASLSARSMVDETVGDSLCVDRLCQSPCSSRASFTFEREVKAEFLVIEGGGVWTDGQLVMTPSDRTRVYKLDGRVTAFVNVTGVGNTERVRLVGEPVNFALPAPTVPNRLGLPGVFVKTYRSTAPTGGVTLSVGDGGGLVAPNGTAVSVARVQNQTFAATDDGAIWQVDGTLWTALSGFTSLILNANEKAPARRLVAVGDRLVVVVAADVKVHDGSREPLLVNRLVTQTPIDALDVETGVWYNRLLEHGIAKNVSDVDVVRWNATAFAVVDRATREAAVFEWRPFPYALAKCTVNTDCRACLTNEASEELCLWCGTRCVSRSTACSITDRSTVNASSVLCTGPTTTAFSTVVSANRTTTGSTSTSTEPATMSTAILSSASADSSVAQTLADASDPLLPLYIVLGVLGALVVVAGIAIAVIKLRDRANANAKDAVEMQVHDDDARKDDGNGKAKAFDPNARYSDIGAPDPVDPRYSEL